MNPTIERIKSLRANRKLGQNFMVNEAIADSEAEYASDRSVVELGPGLGILTARLCARAKRVVAVERDERLYNILSEELKSDNLTLINGDFFKQPDSVFEGCDIMVSNIPYNLSSKTISWLAKFRIEALLCVQEEFAEHMLAKPDTKKYSKLSVTTSLMFNAYQMMRVPRNNFYPVPNVDSMLIYLKPKKEKISPGTMRIISLIMEHKKKSLKNAIMDSQGQLGITKEEAASIAGGFSLSQEKVFKLSPEQIAGIAKELSLSIGSP
ncbi:MAG: ribosomal RNA small subunit methyltransferase A [Candidatus Micrarchaeum sp. ARMAN-1]|jgi:16S rRNA (adenine1518-N6/adenine1519-N6)-dimethyltransferase|nr:MAG: ribosomal RNA small subunit methyltransferase A [Candidatus Micrarchaeum sp. ARMAN-1]